MPQTKKPDAAKSSRDPDIELIAPETVEFEFHGAETAAIPRLPARFTPRKG